jgi:hypothetical protein
MDTIQEQEVPARARLPLRDAVRLSGMSEKTLRRKLEAGLLTGHRETLDYGGFMWMIDAHSLAELYPDSAAVRDYVQQLENGLNDRPLQYENHGPVLPQTTLEPRPASEDDEGEEDEDEGPQGNFVSYLLEENRGLKEDLRDREKQLRTLQERAMQLERECGEQRGTAATQARVLEWFQRQPQPALPSGEPETAPVAAAASGAVSPGVNTQKVWMALAVLAILLLAIKAF